MFSCGHLVGGVGTQIKTGAPAVSPLHSHTCCCQPLLQLPPHRNNPRHCQPLLQLPPHRNTPRHCQLLLQLLLTHSTNNHTDLHSSPGPLQLAAAPPAPPLTTKLTVAKCCSSYYSAAPPHPPFPHAAPIILPLPCHTHRCQLLLQLLPTLIAAGSCHHIVDLPAVCQAVLQLLFCRKTRHQQVMKRHKARTSLLVGCGGRFATAWCAEIAYAFVCRAATRAHDTVPPFKVSTYAFCDT